MDKKSYNLSADVLRTVAIIGVVIIHTANAVYARPDFFNGLSWWIAIILNSFSRIAIPVFILLSGYFLLRKAETIRQTWKRTWTRILIPFLFWFLVYSLWNSGNPTIETINFTLFHRIITVNVFTLYFLVILIGLYLVSPFLRSFLKDASRETQRNLTIGALSLGCVIFAFQYLFHLCNAVDIWSYWIPYTGLFLAGYYFGNHPLKSTKVLLLLYAGGLGITLAGNYVYFLLLSQGNTILATHGCLSHYTDAYLSINVVIMAISAYMLLMGRTIDIAVAWITKGIFSIARSAFGIYVLHILFLDILDAKLHLFANITPLWLYIFVKWFVIFSLSYICTILLLKIPLIRRVFGETK